MKFDTTNNMRSFSERVSPVKARLGNKRLFFLIIILAVLLIGGVAISKLFGGGSSSSVASDKRVDVKDAKAVKKIGREFAFPLKDDKGQEVTKYKFFIDNVELRDQIVVAGKEAFAINGRTFLIVNLKITNDYDKSITINTKDYLRFTIGNNDKELLAADIHNDPVEVQAISTKYTRVGIPIDDNDKNIKLHVGEIKGDKTTIDIKF